MPAARRSAATAALPAPLAGPAPAPAPTSAPTPAPRPPARAPALYIVGYALGRSDAETAFRFPCPPRWDDRPMGASAAELRVRKAYCWTLDALRTGVVVPERVARLARLTREVRSETARQGLEHLRRVQRFVRWSSGGWPVIPTPEVPLDRLVVTAPDAGEDQLTDAELAYRYAWTLDWLRMYRWTIGRGLIVDWRLLGDPSGEAPAAMALAVAVEPGVRPVQTSAAAGWRTAPID